jgi:hypothetical protein
MSCAAASSLDAVIAVRFRLRLFRSAVAYAGRRILLSPYSWDWE